MSNDGAIVSAASRREPTRDHHEVITTSTFGRWPALVLGCTSMEWSWSRRIGLLALACSLSACQRSSSTGSSSPTAVIAPGTAAADELAARVGDRPIRLAEVALQAQAARVDVRRALAALVDSELLAGEAMARGLDRHPEVREAAKQAMVRRFLALTFERELAPASIPPIDLQRVYERNRRRLDHPDLVEVRHLFARTAKSDDPARRAALRERVERVAAAARQIRTPDEFSALAPRFSDDKIKLRGEEIVTAREGWTVPSFATAAFALAREGDVSPVVETEFGYHVVYLVRRIPAEHISFDEALPKLREGMWPEFRRREFLRFVDRLADRHRIEVFAQRLGGEAP